MMYHDIDKYFNKSWKEDHWQILDKDTYEMLLQKYGQNKMNGILSSSDIDLEEDWDQDDNIIE